MYATENFKSKKAFSDAVKSGRQISVYQPNQMVEIDTSEGVFSVEGPWYPKPHSWYATVTVKGGIVVSVK